MNLKFRLSSVILRWFGRRAQREAWAAWNRERAARFVLRDGEEAF